MGPNWVTFVFNNLRREEISSGDIPNSKRCSCWCSPHPSQNLVERSWNPGGTLVEPYLRAGPRSLSGLIDPKASSCWGGGGVPTLGLQGVELSGKAHLALHSSTNY